jgi:5-methylcytosine-specific restriction endonuclease McrA
VAALDPDYCAKRYEANRDKERERVKDWQNANRAKVIDLGKLRRKREREARGFHTESDLALIREFQGDRCRYCSTPLNGAGCRDHTVAVARGGSHWPENIRLVCRSCSSRKHAKSEEQFREEITRRQQWR